jgi:hypothetical protein
MRRLPVLIVLAALIVTSLLIACGPSAEDQTATAQAPASGAGTQVATATRPAGAGTTAPTATAGAQPTTGPGVSTDWCQTGSNWAFSGSGATSSARVEGVVDYKDGEYCRAVYSTTSAGQNFVYTYYFNEDSSDVWSVLDINGEITESHVSDSGSTGDGSDWCATGSSWTSSAAAGFSGTRIEGFAEFKGNTYCKAVYEQNAPGQSIVYTYYFNEDSTDLWMVLNINGEITEQHFSE